MPDNEQTWPGYATQPVAPFETTFERLGKLLSGVATGGRMQIRSREDVWNQHLQEQERANQAAGSQLTGDIARGELGERVNGVPYSEMVARNEGWEAGQFIPQHEAALTLEQERAAAARQLAAERQATQNRLAWEAASKTGRTDAAGLQAAFEAAGGKGQFPAVPIGNNQDLISRGAEGPLAPSTPVIQQSTRPRTIAPETRLEVEGWKGVIAANKGEQDNVRRQIDSQILQQRQTGGTNEAVNQRLTQLEAEERRLKTLGEYYQRKLAEVAGISRDELSPDVTHARADAEKAGGAIAGRVSNRVPETTAPVDMNEELTEEQYDKYIELRANGSTPEEALEQVKGE